ncbi:hypothetical protein D3C76_1283030 [compost metagenome]
MLVGAAPHRVLHHIVVLAVQAQHWNALLAGGHFQLVTEGRCISGEGEYATQWSLPFQKRGVEHHRTTL